MEVVIGLIIGLAGVALAAGVFWLGRREIEGVREDASHLRLELDQAKESARRFEIDKAAAESAQEARIREADNLRTERDEAVKVRDQRAKELSEANADLAKIEADHAARVEEMDKFRTELEQRFAGIASSVTQSTREDFIKEFRDLSKQQSEVSQEAVSNLVKPVRERLAELQKYVDESDKKRAADYAQVSGGVERLLEETSGLRRILHSPGKRGEWGEQHLRNVMQAAGMTDHVDFVEQKQFESEGGAAQPDVVVHIPGGVQVVVDAKTPFEAYDAAMKTDDEDERSRLFGNHARDLLGHARTLKSRDYSRWVEGSPDFVVMYVPTDPMLDVAIDANSGVWQEAWDRHRVLIATPGLLIAFLRTVALAWQQQAIQQNAQDIADSARELYDRLGTYTGHIVRMGSQLGTVVDTYNKSVGSFQSRVLPQARRIEELSEIEESRRFEEPDSVLTEIRELQAPEVHEPEFEALEAGD
ncbi:MAG: DNA recombination protein RmuC [Chloroflexota bacterium]|nr:DNA recombination protein RmuC [Chloroflexota bacterium]